MTFQDVGADYSATLPSGKQVPGIVIHPSGPGGKPTDKQVPGIGGADPWAAAPDYKPPAGAPAGPDPWAAAPDYKPAEPKATRTVGAGEAGAAGAVDAATLGTAPAIRGATEAGETQVDPAQRHEQDQADAMEPSASIGRMLTGAYKAWQGDPVAKDAYDRGREAAAADAKLAQEQHPVAYLGGQLAAAIASAAGGAGGAFKAGTSVGARVLGAAITGAKGGGAYAGGTSIGEGNTPGQVIADTAKGAGTGAVFGGLGGAVVESAGKAGGAVMRTIRGKTNPQREVAGRVATALSTDFERNGNRPPFTRAELQAGHDAGLPIHVVDLGGEQTRGLAQSAAITSRGAKAALEDVIRPRAAEQGYRIGQRLRNLRGRPYADLDQEALKTMQRRANAPAYRRAYQAGDRQLWSPELERLAGADAVAKAAKAAEKSAGDSAIAGGLGAFNPRVTVKNGIITMRGKGGVQTYPNLQFWDHVHRELADAAERAKSMGKATSESSRLGDLDRQLKAELDALVPEFKAARGIAAAGFKSTEAHELGAELVTSTQPAEAVARVLAGLNPFDREVAARAFTAEMATKLEEISRAGDVGSMMSAINRAFVSSIPARQRIRAVLGNAGANEFEALLRIEGITQRAREILSNSDTARKLAEAGVAGGAVATLESMKEGEIDPKTFLVAMLGGGLAYHGIHGFAAKIDEDVARRVGEMLASPDPAVVLRGIQSVSRSPVVFDAFRRVSDAIAKVSTVDVGPRNATAGAVAAVQKLLGEGDGEDHGAHKDSLYDSITQ